MVHWTFWVLVVAVSAVYGEMALHILKHEMMGSMMDTSPTWSPEILGRTLESLGPDGRAAYTDIYTGLALGGDLALPIFYVASLVLLLLHFQSFFWWLPLLAGAGDFFENFTVLHALKNYPKNWNPNDDIYFYGGRVATPIKWIFLILSALALASAVRAKRKEKLKQKNA